MTVTREQVAEAVGEVLRRGHSQGPWLDGAMWEAADAVVALLPGPTAAVDTWRASASSTVTIVAGGRHPITDEMYPLALFHQGRPADEYMATLVARALNAAGVGILVSAQNQHEHHDQQDDQQQTHG